MAEDSGMVREVLERQRVHWENMFSDDPEMFGEAPSDSARKAADVFGKGKMMRILELGGGQGRDTIFFAKNGFQVWALDYSRNGVEAIMSRAQALGISDRVTVKCYDVRKPLPFADEFFDSCYSHMLFCMALMTLELEFLFGEIRRVLRPSGLNIYTVRHTEDAHYGKGIYRGEDMYEVDGFIVHFFSREMVSRLAKGYEIVSVDKFEEGELPRKLFRIVLRKI
ncbi:MAG: class I SAM-dependent methyltransferase [Candidatus Bathyarchaeia archaeon]